MAAPPIGAKSAEKLIILGDIASGLLCRFHLMVDFKKPEPFNGELNKFVTALSRKFPEFPDAPTLQKTPGYDVFAKRATEFSTALRDFYLTFVDLFNFTEEAWRLLTELGKSLTELSYESNLDTMQYYMNLLTRYIQLHYIASMVQDTRMLLMVYAQCYKLTSGNSEPNFHKTARYLQKFASPLKTLQEDCVEISPRIGDTLLRFYMPLAKWSEAKNLADAKVFAVIEDQKALAAPTGERTHLVLLMLERYRQWVLWCFLVCPKELARPTALDLLKLALQDSFTVQLVREKTVSLHQEYEQLFSTYSDPSMPIKLNSNKQKKYLKDAVSEWETTVRLHREMRTYLRLELGQLCNFFTEFPGLLAAKLQMVLAALRLARDEVVWYFRHLHEKPYRHASKWAGIHDTHISFLIHHVFKLSQLVENNKQGIANFHVAFLKGIDVEKVSGAISAFKQAAAGAHPSVLGLLDSIQAAIASATTEGSLEAIRLDWYRCSAVLSLASSRVPVPAMQPLSAVLTTVVQHTRCVDSLPGLLRQHGSFQELYYYRKDCYELLKECLNSTQGQAGHTLHLVHILNQGLQNVHRICPEEQPVIGREAVTLADRFLSTIVHGVEAFVSSHLVPSTQGLRAQTRPLAVFHRIEQLGRGVDAKTLPLAGQESVAALRRSPKIAQLAAVRKGISDLCNAIRESDTITVYNVSFVPREYLYESMKGNIRNALRRVAIKDKNLERPSLMLINLRDVLQSYHAVERYLNLPVSEIIREVLLTEFMDESHGQAGDPVVEEKADEKKEGPPQTLIHVIAAWYSNIFSKDLGELGVYYSPAKRSFVARPVESSRGGPAMVQWEADWFTDPTELHALCTMIGPFGLRVVDRALLGVVAKHTAIIRDVTSKNKHVLDALSNKFTEHQLWCEQVKKLTGVDTLVQATQVVGSTLLFRRLLRDALGEVVKSKVPFLYKAVKLAHTHVHDITSDPRFGAIDYLAQDVGLDVGEADHSVRIVLQQFKTNLADAAVWNAMPDMFALSYVAHRWRLCKYQVAHEGFTNNMHALAEGIRALIVAFQRMPLKTELDPSDPNLRISRDMDKFLKLSAYSILNMAAANKGSNENYPVGSCSIFLEQFVLQSGGRLQLSALEECLPYTLLRTNFISIYQQQAASGGMIEEEKETATPGATGSGVGEALAGTAAAPSSPSSQKS